MDDAIGRAATRNRRIEAHGIDLSQICFTAILRSDLWLLNGFVFEIFSGRTPDCESVACGGRYDDLLRRLGGDTPMTAVGCTFRFAGRVPANGDI
jgi:ATP phosphoribosyltransferase regulatory subunit